jgi:vacuolar protein sorting-associated protein 13A/C
MSTNQAELKGHGVARFSLNNTTLSLKRLVDGAMEVECSIHAFTVSNTRPGQSKFREIIPAARHGRNQLMMLYTVSGGSRPVSMVVANVDSPQVIFSLEPVFAVTDFFMSAFSEEVIPNASAPMQNSEQSTALNVQDADTIGIRLDMRNVSVVILENDADLYSQAVEVSMKQCSFSLQVRTIIPNQCVHSRFPGYIGFGCGATADIFAADEPPF